MLAAARSGSESEDGSREQTGPLAARAFINQGHFWPPGEVQASQPQKWKGGENTPHHLNWT